MGIQQGAGTRRLGKHLGRLIAQLLHRRIRLQEFNEIKNSTSPTPREADGRTIVFRFAGVWRDWKDSTSPMGIQSYRQRNTVIAATAIAPIRLI